jgi:hypothetical protein
MLPNSNHFSIFSVPFALLFPLIITALGYVGAILIPGHHTGKPETLHHVSEQGESKVCFFQIASLLHENHQVNKNLCLMHGQKNPYWQCSSNSIKVWIV